MRTKVTTAALCVRDEEAQVECKLAKVERLVRDDDTFCYTIEPLYQVIDMLAPPLFQGIPGINLDLRRPCYRRENRTPVLISERAPGENREDLHELLAEVGMDYLDPLEWLVRTTTRYGGDPMYLRRWEKDDDIREIDAEKLLRPGVGLARATLEALCQGVDVVVDGFSVDNASRGFVYHLVRRLCLDEKPAKGSSRGRVGKVGRKRFAVYEPALIEVLASYDAGELSARDAASRLGLREPTFYRRLREWRERFGCERTTA